MLKYVNIYRLGNDSFVGRKSPPLPTVKEQYRESPLRRQYLLVGHKSHILLLNHRF